MTPVKDPAEAVVVQLGMLTKAAEAKASHLPPETVTGVAKVIVMGPAELSTNPPEPIRVVGAVPEPLSS